MVVDFCGAQYAPRAGATRQDRCFGYNHLRFAIYNAPFWGLIKRGLHSTMVGTAMSD